MGPAMKGMPVRIAASGTRAVLAAVALSVSLM
jgi:hypothetical protein